MLLLRPRQGTARGPRGGLRRGQPLQGSRGTRAAGVTDRDDDLPPGDRRRAAVGRLQRGAGCRAERAPGRAGGRLGRAWQRSHTYVPRPATTILTTGAPHRAHGSPARRYTRNWSWKEPRTPSTWREASIVAPRASIPACRASTTGAR